MIHHSHLQPPAPSPHSLLYLGGNCGLVGEIDEQVLPPWAEFENVGKAYGHWEAFKLLEHPT
jgi:hypothetical protein